MNYRRMITLFALCATISACDIPDTTMMNGNITLRGNLLTLHAEGAPDAQINSSGALQIGSKSIPISTTQQGLLMLYFQSVMSVHQTGLEMGKIGAGMGAKALKNAVDGKSKAQQDQDADVGGKQLKVLAQKICQDEVSIKNVQDQLATQLPAFKPYAGIVSDKRLADCTKG